MMQHTDLTALSPWVAAFGLCMGTRVETAHGPRAVETLEIGDRLVTEEDGLVPITGLRRTIGLPAERNHYPVWIAQGALGFGLPHRDLELGPQHRVLFRHIRVPLMFGVDAVLVRAKSLAACRESIAVRRATEPTSFVQIILPRQSLILAEGVPVETLLPDGECDLPYPTLRSWELRTAVA